MNHTADLARRRCQSDKPVDSGRSIRQSHHVFANSFAGHKAEGRAGAGEVGRAVTKNDRAEIEAILVDET